jgi:hypothetical protein
MSTKSPPLPTAAEIQAEIDGAQQDLLAANRALGEALFAKAGEPDRDVGPEQDALEAARRTIDQLSALLPIVENAERVALDETRAKLAAEQMRRMAKELKGLITSALQFSAAYQNAVSAWRRGCDAIDRARLLLPAEMRLHGLGWERRLSAHWLHEKCTLEIARLGLVPVTDRPYGTNVLSAPGARADAVNTLRQASSPQTIPPLETEVRQMLAEVLAAAAQEPEEAKNAVSAEVTDHRHRLELGAERACRSYRPAQKEHQLAASYAMRSRPPLVFARGP